MDKYGNRKEEEQGRKNKDKIRMPLIPTIIFGLMFPSSIISIFAKFGVMNLYFAGITLFGAILFIIIGRYSTTGKYYEELDEDTQGTIRVQGSIIIIYGVTLLILGILAILLYFVQI